jgi:preprotein translocase subunit SecF
MHILGRTLQALLTGSILSFLLLSCGSDRVNIEFKTPRQIYVDDSKTDPDRLNEELEYDLREIEKKRRQKEREAAKAKAEAEQKTKAEQQIQEQPADEENAGIQLEETEQVTPEK